MKRTTPDPKDKIWPFRVNSIAVTIRVASDGQGSCFLVRLGDDLLWRTLRRVDRQSLGRLFLVAKSSVTFNQDGRPLELTVATYRGDRYQFRALITNEG